MYLRLPMILLSIPRLRIFSEVGKETEMFVRFSTVAGEEVQQMPKRDIRGFAMKFYTEEGNWDLVGNNTPVFFFRDPMHFIDLNHAVKEILEPTLEALTLTGTFGHPYLKPFIK